MPIIQNRRTFLASAAAACAVVVLASAAQVLAEPPPDTTSARLPRLQDTSMIQSSPRELVANGTDWRFLDELKRELKT